MLVSSEFTNIHAKSPLILTEMNKDCSKIITIYSPFGGSEYREINA